jgi:hypothetical protein
MQGCLKSAEVQAACQDLNMRTLVHIRGDFARLVYVASTRDYNTGEYHHDGLAWRFGEKTAQDALASCHWSVFRRMVLCSFSELVGQLETYASSTHLSRSDFVSTWSCLQAYRVLIPRTSTALTSHFFSSNVRAALAILQSRQVAALQRPQSA